jgi:hypothetical protein
MRWLALALVAIGLVACGSDGRTGQPPAASTDTPSDLPATTEATPTPEAVRLNIRPTRLTIPSLNIDTEVQVSRMIPVTSQGVPPPGCPQPAPSEQTLTVPDYGVATPLDSMEGLENRAWIFGHSRWLNQPGLFFGLPNINHGDEVIIDGVDRATGEAIEGKRFVVDAIYLTDTNSGQDVFFSGVPAKPLVMLQTSVREDGAGKQWLFSQERLLAKATNVVKGDLNDPCKYLLLFVIATAES